MSSKLSIISIVKNDLQGMRETLDSVLNQTWSDFQLVIVDGNSSDGTYEYLQSQKGDIDILIHEPDSGIYDAMNKGLDKASGEWLLFLNAGDTLSHPDFLDLLFKSEISTMKIISCPYYLLNGSDQKTLVFPKSFNQINLLIWGTRTANHQSLFVKKEIAPIYDTSFKLKAELNWYFELAKVTKREEILLLDEPSTNYKLGGIGEQRLSLNLREHLKVLFRHKGILGILGIPLLVFKYLRTTLRNR